MERLGIVLCVVAIWCGTASAWAEDGSKSAEEERPGGVARSEPLPLGERVSFYSAIYQDEVSMQIWVPESFAMSSPEHTYPVIFVSGSHGREFFHTLTGLVKHLGSRERMPESIVVSLNEMGSVPTIHTHGMWRAQTIGGSGDPEPDVRHLREEVIPFLERTYRANHRRMIVGVSGSSLFPIYTKTAAPDLFDTYVLIAAADMFGMGYTADSTFLDTFEEHLAENPQQTAKLYVGLGEADLEGRPDYRANLDELTGRFAEGNRLDVKVDIFSRTDHYEAFLDGMQAALDWVYPYERWSARYRDLVAQPGDALENIDRYYRQLSDDYGFEILPRADRWNNVNCLRFMTRHLIQLERHVEAVRVAERRILYQPGTLGSLVGLVDAYEANGQINDAVAALKNAMERARTDGNGSVEGLGERLTALEKRLDRP